jgi:cytochrome c
MSMPHTGHGQLMSRRKSGNMSNSDKLNNVAMAVLSAALFAFGGKTLIDIVAPGHAPAKPSYALPASTGGGGGATAAAAGFTFAKVAELLPKANADAGADTYKKCAACHTDAKDAPNKVGPNLWGVIGRPVGQHAGFAYSEAVKTKGGNWTWETLAAYLHDPRNAIPGNKMAFAGVTDTADLADLLAYLNKQSDKPADLPK